MPRHFKPWGNYGTINLLDGLEAWWKLDEASGDALDAHGANDLTDGNTVGSAAGKVNNARDFDDTSSEYFSIADNASLSFGDEELTIAGWCFMQSGSGVIRTIAAKRQDTTIEYILRHDGGVSGKLAFYVSSDGSSFTSTTANTFGATPNDTWMFVVAQHDPTNNLIKISVNNGAFDTAAHSTGVFNGSSQFQLGCYVNTGTPSELWGGLIDEVGVWRRLLSDPEITFLYNSGNGVTYEDL